MGSSLSKKCSIAAVSVAVMAGTALLATPANSASTSMVFSCTTPVGPKDFITVADTDVPATMVAGATAPITTTAQVTIPEDLVGLLRDVVGARRVDGSAVTKSTLDGTPLADVTHSIASMPLPASGALTVTAVGTPANYTGTVGTHVIKAASYTAHLVFHKDAGDPFVVDTTCTPQTVDNNGTPDNTADDKPLVQDLTVDTFKVDPAPTVTPVPAKSDTTSKVTTKYSAKSNNAKVKVVVKAASGQATGSVKVTLKRGSKKVKSVSAKLVSGTAKVVFKKISRPGKYKVIAKYPGSSTTNASSGKDTFKVRR
ncbi:hypothetical protein [Nocardioides piscis]|uniref:Ig-like domain repeat protein n=1 Tax=Nocardioides piscis TaxID=2714938 RepID=A0A6G7YGE0_9ACTN|nr:hypothetical protein [Nocardioides piscis]QIK75964.1 hypothetical protein G7071_11460 [Nocardioides piscis]